MISQKNYQVHFLEKRKVPAVHVNNSQLDADQPPHIRALRQQARAKLAARNQEAQSEDDDGKTLESIASEVSVSNKIKKANVNHVL